MGGAAGDLFCLSVETGEILWEKHYIADYESFIPTWGVASSPIVDGDRLITVVGGEEKRDAERRAHERHNFPLRTVANVFFLIGLGTLFYMLAVFFLALQSAVVSVLPSTVI